MRTTRHYRPLGFRFVSDKPAKVPPARVVRIIESARTALQKVNRATLPGTIARFTFCNAVRADSMMRTTRAGGTFAGLSDTKRNPTGR